MRRTFPYIGGERKRCRDGDSESYVSIPQGSSHSLRCNSQYILPPFLNTPSCLRHFPPITPTFSQLLSSSNICSSCLAFWLDRLSVLLRRKYETHYGLPTHKSPGIHPDSSRRVGPLKMASSSPEREVLSSKGRVPSPNRLVLRSIVSRFQ
jgi:hypothetical protein